MTIPKKGLRNIKTMTTKSGEKMTPHKAYISAASLEIEKRRHIQEMSILHHRISALNARLQQIKNEQERITCILDNTREKVVQHASSFSRQDKLKSGIKENSGRFKIKY